MFDYVFYYQDLKKQDKRVAESIPSIPSPSPPSAPTTAPSTATHVIAPAKVKSADQNTHSPNPADHATTSTKVRTHTKVLFTHLKLCHVLFFMY